MPQILHELKCGICGTKNLKHHVIITTMGFCYDDPAYDRYAWMKGVSKK